MTKKLLLLLVTCLFTSCLFACSSGTEPADDKPTTTVAEVTTKEPTTPEATTPEVTTEETTTEYVWKSDGFVVDASLKDYFMDLTIEKGDKIYLNDLIGEDDGDEYDRGGLGFEIAYVLFFKNHRDKLDEYAYTYIEVGSARYSAPYDQNVVIEYNEEEKIYFYFVEEVNGYACFDVYEID